MSSDRQNLGWSIDIDVEVDEASVVLDAFVRFKNAMLEDGAKINALILWDSSHDSPVLGYRDEDYRAEEEETS
jgi:hypothetical protein